MHPRADASNAAGVTALVVGTDDWATEQAAEALTTAGAAVLRCHDPGRPAFPCNAFLPGQQCPLDVGFDVVITARARPSRVIEPGEVGVVCALRTGRPLIVAGITAHSPFGETATEIVREEGDLAKACRDAIGLVSVRGDRRVADPSVVDLRGLRR